MFAMDRWPLIFPALVSILCAQQPAPIADDGLAALRSVEAGFRTLADRTHPFVVTVRGFVKDPDAQPQNNLEVTQGWTVATTDEAYPGFRVNAGQSGIVMSKEGYILTCLHGLLQADGAPVDLIDVETMDQRHTIAALVGAEPTLNLAVLKLQAFNPNYPPQFTVAKFGNSAAIDSGHWAFAVGNPTGPEKVFSIGTFTTGPSRDCYQELLTAFYLQASVTVHSEAYGGALINSSGEVMGMLSPRQPPAGPIVSGPTYGITFALPSNIIQGLYKALIQKGSLRSPWLGFSVTSRTELIKDRGIAAFNALDKPRNGILIENTFAPGPGSRSGIQAGDFLVGFNGETIHTPVDFQRNLYLSGIGSTVTLDLYRAGAEIQVSLRIEERPKNAIQR